MAIPSRATKIDGVDYDVLVIDDPIRPDRAGLYSAARARAARMVAGSLREDYAAAAAYYKRILLGQLGVAPSDDAIEMIQGAWWDAPPSEQAARRFALAGVPDDEHLLDDDEEEPGG